MYQSSVESTRMSPSTIENRDGYVNGFAGIERQVVPEGERAVVVGADALRRHHRAVPDEAGLERVAAAAGHVGEGVLEGVVPAVGAAVRRGQARVEVRVRVPRSDVELVAAVQPDVLEVVDPAGRA